MSERLAISAALSVLMMSAFLLFGTDGDGLTFQPGGIDSALDVEMPHVQAAPSALLPFAR